MKLYNKFAVLLYKGGPEFRILWSADVLSEEAILEWFERGHSPKGKTVFLEQMQQLVDWLRNAEEGLPLPF